MKHVRASELSTLPQHLLSSSGRYHHPDNTVSINPHASHLHSLVHLKAVPSAVDAVVAPAPDRAIVATACIAITRAMIVTMDTTIVIGPVVVVVRPLPVREAGATTVFSMMSSVVVPELTHHRHPPRSRRGSSMLPCWLSFLPLVEPVVRIFLARRRA
jgi:hypothetical protein